MGALSYKASDFAYTPHTRNAVRRSSPVEPPTVGSLRTIEPVEPGRSPVTRYSCPTCQSEQIRITEELGHDYFMGYFDIFILTCQRCRRSNAYHAFSRLDDGELPPGAEVWRTAHPDVP